ncbi:MAG: flavodoxin family protein [Pseudomonadota bacterium]
MSVVIVYSTGSGHTRRLAEYVAEGAGGAPMIDVEGMTEADWATLDAAEAIIFGAPTYMGSASAPFKAFMDETSDRWVDQVWADKIAGGFTVANCPSGDKMMVHLQFVVLAAQHGMIWVGQTEMNDKGAAVGFGINVEGANLGLGATSSEDKTSLIDPGDAETARRYGARIKHTAERWAAG